MIGENDYLNMKFIIGKMKNTIEEIEQSFWGVPPEDASNLVTKCQMLRKKDLDEFEVEDLRLLIGQNIALDILIPKALTVLKGNLLAEGVCYEGDLLKNVLTSEQAFWKTYPELKAELTILYEKNIKVLDELDIIDEIKEGIKQAFIAFKQEG